MQTEAAVGRLDELAAALNASDLIHSVLAPVVRATMQAAPVMTGTLRRSIRINAISGSSGHASGTYSPHVIYARIQDQGGTIRSKNISSRTGKPLILADARTRRFFGREVHIPGQHYMSRGADAGAQEAYDTLSDRVRAAFQ